MEILQQIQHAYAASASYPDLVQQLIALGIQSYTVDTSSEIVLYRLTNGRNALLDDNHPSREIAVKFNYDLTVLAVKDTQQGKTTYPVFLDDIAKAGVRFYEATLAGEDKRIIYVGRGGSYEEKIPG